MEFGIVSLFPRMFKALDEGIVGRAKQRGIISVDCWNPREYSTENHQRVDDRPYGGGPGMVMMAEPLRNAINAAKKAAEQPHKVIYLSPQGKLFNQTMAKEVIAEEQRLIFVCGRYEGVDERLIDTEIDEEWSIGDYVLSGGELPAMLLMEVNVCSENPRLRKYGGSCSATNYVHSFANPRRFDDPRLVLQAGLPSY